MHFVGTRLTTVLTLLAVVLSWSVTPVKLLAADRPPKVGDTAEDVEWPSLSGGKVQLSEMATKGPVVLVVLRGFPGYQCPICNRQVADFLKQADKFKAAGAQVVLVYPGPSKNLDTRAKEFYGDKTIPDHFRLVLDPDYAFTKKYGLRWDAANETAYPSAFVILKDRKVAFANVSKSHGGRTKPEETLKALEAAQ